jgi:hypothetical protein
MYKSLALAGLTAAIGARAQAPATQYVHATLQGAADAQFDITIPADGSTQYISNPLSISHVITDGGFCTFTGIDRLSLPTSGGLVDVGPPQTLTEVVCYPSGGYKERRTSTGYVHATMQGANPPEAQYELWIPTDGSDYYISDPLSLSHIITDGGSCTFFGIDGLVLSKPAAGLVDVGPPQTITKANCYPGGYKAKRFAA